MGRRAAVAVLLAMASGSPSAAHAWLVRLGGLGTVAGPVAAGPQGEAFAALSYPLPRHSGSVAVVKLAPDGDRVWRRSLVAAGDEHSDAVHALAVAADGDVIAAGGVEREPDVDFFVTRLAAGSGRPRWRRFVTGAARPAHYHEAQAMVLDPAGDVVAAGTLESATAEQYHSTADLAVVKLAGATGSERWRFVLDGSAHDHDSASAVAVDPAGDVLVVGTVSEPGEPGDFYRRPLAVLKLAGADGHPLWRQTLGDTWRATSMVADAAGDAVLAGSSSEAAGNDFVVVKLSGTTGTIRWQTHVSGSTGRWEEAFAVVTLSTGDVAAAGFTADAADAKSLTLVALDGATGTVRWRRDLQGTDGHGFGRAIIRGPLGRILVGGEVRNRGSCYDAVVLEVDEASGAVVREHTVDGRATASVCDVECDVRPPCGPPRGGIDRDALGGLTADARGRAIVAGAIHDDPRGGGRGFVARPR